MQRRKYGTVPRRKNRTGLHSRCRGAVLSNHAKKNRTGLHSCRRGAVLSKRVSSRSVFLHIEIVPRTPRWSWPNAQIQSANPYRSNEVSRTHGWKPVSFDQCCAFQTEIQTPKPWRRKSAIYPLTSAEGYETILASKFGG